jgi:UDP-N-acetylmuramate dehydrogenase
VKRPRRSSGQLGTVSSHIIPNAPHLKISEQASMSLFTTWRIGGPADLLIRVATPADLVAASNWARDEGFPVTVIGGGSNVLVGDRGIRGLVIVSRTPGERAEGLISVEDEGDHVVLRAGAQAPLSWVGRYCAERGWGGMDWGVGLPGTIGGATVNNAGAHGTEQKDHLIGVVVLNNSGDVETYDRAWLAPRYRHTALKDAPRPRPYHVLETIFRLPKSDPIELTRLATEHADYRHLTQPTGACAGSTFTNPPGDFAGRLLEAAGFKGFAIGGVSFSTKHSNFIVNSGDGTAAQVRELIATAQSRIAEEFGIHLEPEIEEIGER